MATNPSQHCQNTTVSGYLRGGGGVGGVCHALAMANPVLSAPTPLDGGTAYQSRATGRGGWWPVSSSSSPFITCVASSPTFLPDQTRTINNIPRAGALKLPSRPSAPSFLRPPHSGLPSSSPPLTSDLVPIHRAGAFKLPKGPHFSLWQPRLAQPSPRKTKVIQRRFVLCCAVGGGIKVLDNLRLLLCAVSCGGGNRAV